MVNIGIEQQLSNSALYDHRCLGIIKKLYKYAGKFDDKHEYKYIIKANIVSTPEGLTENNPMNVGMWVTMKKPSERNPPSHFFALLDVTQKLLSTEWGLLKQLRPSRQVVLYGTVLIIGGDIKNQVKC